jgi:hypothetical protein
VLLVRVETRLNHVLAIVCALANELLVTGHGREQAHILQCHRGAVRFCQLGELGCADKLSRAPGRPGKRHNLLVADDSPT